MSFAKIAEYSCIVADPPWAFGDKLPGKTRGAVKNYTVMSVDGVCALGRWRGSEPLDDKTPPFLAMCGKRFAIADDCLLFLWRVSSQVEEAYSVCRAWGFVPKSEIVWIKTTQPMREIYDLKDRTQLVAVLPKLAFGMGRYTRASHETCIIAARGKATRLVQSKSERSVFFAPRGEHSEKPAALYEIVERLVGPDAKKLELFARAPRPGWTTAGDEIGVLKTSRDGG